MTRPAARIPAVVLLAAAAAGGCGGGEAQRPVPQPMAIAWQESALPADDAVMVREAAECGGSWLVAGALRDSSGGTRPALWRSPDGRTWTPMTVAGRSYYGRQNILYALACRNGRVAALGAKVGGAHGNPRTSSWQERSDGVLHEVGAPFELFGGPQAMDVRRLAAGPSGFLIAGNRMSGAAVWTSPDAARFAIAERAPALATDAIAETYAFDAVATADGWLVAGGARLTDRTDRDPMGWRSADGRTWTRVPAAAPATGYEELQRVAAPPGAPVAVGVNGPAFGAWRLTGGEWQRAGTFGEVRLGSSVRSLTVAGDRLFAVTAGDRGHEAWVSQDRGGSWGPVAVASVPAGADRTMTMNAGQNGQLILLADDGTAGRVFLGAAPS